MSRIMIALPNKVAAPTRVGLVLAAVGVAGFAFTASHATGWWLLTYGVDVLALLVGALLLRGNVPTLRWAGAVMAFGAGATLVGLIGLAVVWPLDLTLTELRLDPIMFVWPAATLIVTVCVELWIVWELGREPVRATIAGAGLRPWDPATPAKVGAAVMFVAVVLLWAALHGNSAAVAVSQAEQQLGPDYRYALTWIGPASRGGHGAVDGVVTAWNKREVRTVLLHWEQR
jgi:hypothetical protein